MEQQHIIYNIPVLWRGTKYMVEISSDSTLRDLGQELLKITEVKADTMRLIVPQFSSKSSKMLYPFSDEDGCLALQKFSIFKDNKPIRMMGVSKNEVDEVLNNAKKNERIVGFDEEEKRLKQRMSSKPRGVLKLPEGPYVFCEFRTLQIPGIELNPSASEALKRMHMLAADPGIVAIMNKHHWRVGIMTEMAPIGYVGVSPKCILGFNKNHGEEISLRLRTDDLKGFRKYESIKKTLLHELAHMIFSEHDANFYALDKQLNEEAAALDWTRSKSHTLTGMKYSQYHEEDDVEDGFGVSQKLGGSMSHQLVNARAASVAAAYHRMTNTSDYSSGVPTVSAESNPNSSNHQNKLEPDPDDSAYPKLDPDSDGNSNDQNMLGLDSNNSSNHKSKLEPASDDSIGSKNLESECEPRFIKSLVVQTDLSSTEVHPVLATNSRLLEATKLYGEPDIDDMGSSSNSKVIDTDHFSQGMQNLDCNTSQRMVVETDPDALGEKVNTLGSGRATGHNEADCLEAGLVTNQSHLSINCKKHDTIQGEEPMLIEPDPDEGLVHQVDSSKMAVDQLDPDDQEIQRIQDSVSVVCNRLREAITKLLAEVKPSESSAVVQTLFKIVKNVIEHPDEMKYRKLRKANPIIQKNVANYKAALEILFLIGFIEDALLDEIGKAETFLVLKRNDPGLLWLAKSTLETCNAS
ncbi:hypothetical protein IC582_026401 [Cucumis melo]|uniref:Uncharacterized protein LOC103496343 n=3 Tax=Cucumis melo TaxID=3656 RepID=A0A1S3C3T6_CUCME|nr:uncharacterized protein LOC103496343 isoform X1 [Cucumis melo]KAA0054508.1 putative Ubiquitin and WLM domain-containing protein [Cucumis melo var. makuwa]TYJ98287.1 putative Ubiquitin and WLM domain-containing protein [Cucumis melo var. makuwa]